MDTKYYVVTLFLLGLISTTTFAQTRLEVTIRNVKESKGNLRVGLFTNEKDFLKNAAVGKVVKAQQGEVKVVFENLQPGDYAVSVIHDQNENGELDSNFVGIPTEGFAFGNNAMGTFGPPAFEKAKIVIGKNKDEEQAIDLRYF
jgi:uncharacterized protein (DUF2141 family)